MKSIDENFSLSAQQMEEILRHRLKFLLGEITDGIAIRYSNYDNALHYGVDMKFISDDEMIKNINIASQRMNLEYVNNKERLSIISEEIQTFKNKRFNRKNLEYQKYLLQRHSWILNQILQVTIQQKDKESNLVADMPIAIYGCGETGRALANLLFRNYPIYFIDRNAENCALLPFAKVYSTKKKNYPKTQMVIVTPIEHRKDIVSFIINDMNLPYIMVEDFLLRWINEN